MNIDDFLQGRSEPDEDTILTGKDLAQVYWFIKDCLEEKDRLSNYWKETLETVDKQAKQLRDLEKTHIEKDKLAAIGSMSTGISHEFNNSLNNLQQGIVAIRVLLERKDIERIKKMLLDMEKIISLSSETIKSIKGLQKIEDQNKSIDLYSFVNTICNLYKGLTFDHFSIENRIPSGIRIEVNELILYNSLANLIKNSIEASEDSPRKEIVIEAIPIETNHLQIDISDFGSGVLESAKETLFDGITSKEDGLGFGLKNSKENLKKINGDLELIHLSNPTTFRITLRG